MSEQFYEECEVCKSVNCTPDSFNRHVGSMIALQKVITELDVLAYIVK